MSTERKLREVGTGGYNAPIEMLCKPTTKLVSEDGDCPRCDGDGVEPFTIRARCKACDGTGRHFVVYHDGSMFAGRDFRGVVREYYCPEHGVQKEHVVGVRRCCDKRTLRLAEPRRGDK